MRSLRRPQILLLVVALFAAGCDWLAYSPTGAYPTCGLNTCGANARCEVTHDDAGPVYRCVCDEGYAGDGQTCTQQAKGPCATNNGGCDVNAICSDSSGSATCACKQGWTGEGHACVDVDECATNNGGCDPLTTCTNTPGARTCGACPSGYTGDGSSGCVDIDECATNDGGCGANEVCSNLPGSSQCACKTGYTRDGEACVDIDECKSNNGGCDPLTACSNSGGSFACSACPAGYTGSGETGCTDVNECATSNGGCDRLTTCTNTPGARTCGACPSGYTGDGATGCVDVNECATNNGGCDPLTTCTNRPGGRTCGACPAGYAGSGQTGCVWSDPSLSALELSQGQLQPAFAPGTTSYRLGVQLGVTTLSVRPTVRNAQGATIRVDGAVVASGELSVAKSLALGSNTMTVEVRAQAGATRTYTLTIERALFGLQEAYAKASSPGVSDGFGQSVAVSGDTLVVGVPADDSGATGVNGNASDDSARDSGAVYVFVRSGGAWTQQAYIKASNTGADDAFGRSVSLSGDTLVVGASGEDSSAIGVNGDQANDGASGSGAAYVFVRSGTTWSQQAYLKASNTRMSTEFGRSVALSADTLAVGSRLESSSARGVNGDGTNTNAGFSGAVYVFTRSGTTWSQQAYLKSSNSESGDKFGASVALSGETLAVGAVDEDGSATGVNGNQASNSASGSGAVYVFTRSGTTWSQQAYIKASNTEANDQFGYSVALSGDTLAVSTPFEGSSATGVNGNQADNSASWSGAAYVFTRSGTTWSQQAYLKASNTEANDQFGSSVALSGDTLVASAPAEASNATGVNGDQSNNGASACGAVYAFVRTGTSWSQQAYIKASNAGSSDLFGMSVALSGDTLAVGAPGESSSATGVNGDQSNNGTQAAGAAYVFLR